MTMTTMSTATTSPTAMSITAMAGIMVITMGIITTIM